MCNCDHYRTGRHLRDCPAWKPCTCVMQLISPDAAEGHGVSCPRFRPVWVTKQQARDKTGAIYTK